MAIFEFLDLIESQLDGSATGGGPPVVTTKLREAGATDGSMGQDIEVWGQGCILFRPAAPTEAGKCQGLVARIGGTPVVVATRDSRAPEAVGNLGDGDAAFCSPTGKVALICKGNGSMSMLKQNAAGDAMWAIEEDGTLIGRNQWGQLQLDEEGFAVILATGECLKLGPKGFTVTGAACCLATQTVKLGANALQPLNFAPASGIKPSPHITV